jgi:hypothetical protein
MVLTRIPYLWKIKENGMENLSVLPNGFGIVVSLLCVALTTTTAAQTTTGNTATKTTAYAVGACHFRIQSQLFGGNFMVHREGTPTVGIFTYPNTSSTSSVGLSNGFTLFCVDASDENIGTMLNARQINGKWLMYNPWPGPGEPELTPVDQGAHPRTVPFKGNNWTGTGLTVDATTGDEKRRARTFYFCLIHQAHALCGKSPVQWLANPSKHNELWKIRAILQSIEFVDAPSPVESSPEAGLHSCGSFGQVAATVNFGSPITTYLENASIKLTSREWVLDTSKEDPNFPNPHTTFYALHGKGWEGGGTTQDQTEGDEDRRTRAFNFCIPHRQLALCGSVQSERYLASSPSPCSR